MLRSPQTPTELTKLALQSSELEVFQQGEDIGASRFRGVRTRALPTGETVPTRALTARKQQEARRLLLATSLWDLRRIRSNASECQPSF